jgi:hypothetical protein
MSYLLGKWPILRLEGTSILYSYENEANMSESTGIETDSALTFISLFRRQQSEQITYLRSSRTAN